MNFVTVKIYDGFSKGDHKQHSFPFSFTSIYFHFLRLHLQEPLQARLTHLIF